MDWRLLLLMIVLGAVFGALSSAVVATLQQRRSRRTGTFGCALRSLGSGATDLPRRWRHGVGRVEAGALHFRPGGPGGLRWPQGTLVTIEVVGVSGEAWRAPRARDFLILSPALRILTLSTADGPVELAAFRRDLVRINPVLRSSPEN